MNLQAFRQALADYPDHGVRIEVTGGEPLADHFHVTEVGRVEKRFVDCGGARRSTVACVLQTLVAHDTDHRLSTTKLAGILGLADSLELTGDTPVEVEHQERSVSIDVVEGFEVPAAPSSSASPPSRRPASPRTPAAWGSSPTARFCA